MTEPREGECVLCFVARMVDDVGCDGTLRWVHGFRDVRVPGASGLERRLGRSATCDCRTVQRGFVLVRELWERDVHTDELRLPDRRPACAEVPASSTRPCRCWERAPRRTSTGPVPP